MSAWRPCRGGLRGSPPRCGDGPRPSPGRPGRRPGGVPGDPRGRPGRARRPRLPGHGRGGQPGDLGGLRRARASCGRPSQRPVRAALRQGSSAQRPLAGPAAGRRGPPRPAALRPALPAALAAGGPGAILAAAAPHGSGRRGLDRGRQPRGGLGRGILAEAFRWAELEQLVYSPRTFERRLVGATLATLPHRVPAARSGELPGRARAARSWTSWRMLMGDAEQMVQKALSWAIRELDALRPARPSRPCSTRRPRAAEHDRRRRPRLGHPGLAGAPAARARATELRDRLAGLRRDRRRPSTSHRREPLGAGFAALIEAHDAARPPG